MPSVSWEKEGFPDRACWGNVSRRRQLWEGCQRPWVVEAGGAERAKVTGWPKAGCESSEGRGREGLGEHFGLGRSGPRAPAGLVPFLVRGWLRCQQSLLLTTLTSGQLSQCCPLMWSGGEHPPSRRSLPGGCSGSPFRVGSLWEPRKPAKFQPQVGAPVALGGPP